MRPCERRPHRHPRPGWRAEAGRLGCLILITSPCDCCRHCQFLRPALREGAGQPERLILITNLDECHHRCLCPGPMAGVELPVCQLRRGRRRVRRSRCPDPEWMEAEAQPARLCPTTSRIGHYHRCRFPAPSEVEERLANQRRRGRPRGHCHRRDRCPLRLEAAPPLVRQHQRAILPVRHHRLRLLVPREVAARLPNDRPSSNRCVRR